MLWARCRKFQTKVNFPSLVNNKLNVTSGGEEVWFNKVFSPFFACLTPIHPVSERVCFFLYLSMTHSRLLCKPLTTGNINIFTGGICVWINHDGLHQAPRFQLLALPGYVSVKSANLVVKGIVHSILKFYPFTAQFIGDGGSGDIFQFT